MHKSYREVKNNCVGHDTSPAVQVSALSCANKLNTTLDHLQLIKPRNRTSNT